jgi:hypothetical protein
MTLVIHDGVLYILGRTSQPGAEVKEVRAPVRKHRGVLIVSGNNLSSVAYHIRNANKEHYQPRGSILEIHPGGEVYRYTSNHEAKQCQINGIDSKGTFISGGGRKQILAALDLCRGDIRKALKQAAEYCTSIKPTDPVYVYKLPEPVDSAEPDETFSLDDC